MLNGAGGLQIEGEGGRFVDNTEKGGIGVLKFVIVNFCRLATNMLREIYSLWNFSGTQGKALGLHDGATLIGQKNSKINMRHGIACIN